MSLVHVDSAFGAPVVNLGETQGVDWMVTDSLQVKGRQNNGPDGLAVMVTDETTTSGLPRGIIIIIPC